MFAFANYYNKYQPDTMQQTWIVIIGLIVLTGFAWLVMTWYDIPVRKYLAKLRNNS